MNKRDICKVLKQLILIVTLCPILISVGIFLSLPDLKLFSIDLRYSSIILILSAVMSLGLTLLVLNKKPQLVKVLGISIFFISMLSFYASNSTYEGIRFFWLPISLSICFLILGLFLVFYSKQHLKSVRHYFFPLFLTVLILFFGCAVVLSVCFPIFTFYIFPKEIYFDLFSSLIIIAFSFSCVSVVLRDFLLNFRYFVKFIPLLAFEFFLLLTTCFSLGIRSEKIQLLDSNIFTHQELYHSLDYLKDSLEETILQAHDLSVLIKKTHGEEDRVRSFINTTSEQNPRLIALLFLDKSRYTDPETNLKESDYKKYLKEYLKLESCEQITKSKKSMFFVTGENDTATLQVAHIFCYNKDKIGLLVLSYSLLDFIYEAFGSKRLEEFYFELQSDEKEIFSNIPKLESSFKKYHQTANFHFYNINWEVSVSIKKPSYLDTVEHEIVWITLLVGIFLSCVIGYCLYLWMAVRRNEDRLYEVQNSLVDYQAFLNIALTTAKVGVWKYTISTKEIYLDPHMYNLLEIPDEIKISTLEEFLKIFPIEQRDLFREQIDLLCNNNSHLQVKTSIIRKNGKVKNIFTIAEVSFNQQSTQTHVIGVSHDITDKERLKAIKSEFISNISHSLRTPLTSIHGGIILLKKELEFSDSPKVLDLLSIVHKNSDKMLGLITNLLDIQKMEEGCYKFKFETLDILKLVKESIEMNIPIASQKSIEIRLETPNVSAEVRADYAKLIEVMDNLLSNAIKFSHSDSQILVRIIKNNGFVRVEVEDRGEGMASEFETQVFNRFSKEDVLNRKEGSGIGLNASKKIIEAHKGTLLFITELSKGSTFYFEILINGK